MIMLFIQTKLSKLGSLCQTGILTYMIKQKCVAGEETKFVKRLPSMHKGLVATPST